MTDERTRADDPAAAAAAAFRAMEQSSSDRRACVLSYWFLTWLKALTILARR